MAQINLSAAERDALLAALKSAAPQQKTLIGRLDGLRFNTRACVVCGAEFEATNPRKKTCSDACRQALSRSNRHATAVGRSKGVPDHRSSPKPSQSHRDTPGHRHAPLTTPPIGQPSAREWLLVRLDAHPQQWLKAHLLIQDNELNAIHRGTKLVTANSLIKANAIAFDSPARSEANRQQGLRSFSFAVHAPSGTIWDEGIGIPSAIGALVQELLKGTAPQLAIGIAQAVEATSALMSQPERDAQLPSVPSKGVPSIEGTLKGCHAQAVTVPPAPKGPRNRKVWYRLRVTVKLQPDGSHVVTKVYDHASCLIGYNNEPPVTEAAFHDGFPEFTAAVGRATAGSAVYQDQWVFSFGMHVDGTPWIGDLEVPELAIAKAQELVTAAA